ncbi:hypothetical protein PGQ11_008974 [Apiospora arundinis]|uniref:Uncharacterized protein n=1 Tax=Apiospora arundinis TaxID=335852 RepID=A0ABR2IGR3_9PEZI
MKSQKYLLHVVAPLMLLAQGSVTQATPATTFAPLPTLSSEDKLNATRQGGIFGDIAGIVVNQILDGVFGFLKDDAEKEAKWVDETLNQLHKRYPDNNVLIFHNDKSKLKVNNGAISEHYELNRFIGTYGYAIWVFSTGTFKLEGNNEKKEWGYVGCITKNSDLAGVKLDFCDPKKEKHQQPQSTTTKSQASATHKTNPSSATHASTHHTTTTHSTTSQHPKATTFTRTVSQKPTTITRTQDPATVTALGVPQDDTNPESGNKGGDGNSQGTAGGQGQNQGQGQGQGGSNSGPTSSRNAGVPKATGQPASAAAAVVVGLAALCLVIP